VTGKPILLLQEVIEPRLNTLLALVKKVIGVQ
jgi:hypothetical protein